MKKPIDKKYLADTLKSFDAEVSEKKYLHKDDTSLHTHDNKTILDKIGESDKGAFLFNGIEITKGIDGINGIDGVDGKSAYDIAVDHGFIGTETEWLESLKADYGDIVKITLSATEPTNVAKGEIVMVYEE